MLRIFAQLLHTNICRFNKKQINIGNNDMNKIVIDKINYIIALITEFAQRHQLSTQQAYLYLKKYKGLEFVDEFYDVEHTQSFENSVEDITFYCHRMGGQLQ